MPYRRKHVVGGLLLAAVGALLLIAVTGSAHAQNKNRKPLKQDEACLACHAQADLKSEKGKSVAIDAVKHAASAHAILGCKDCHTAIKDFPHPVKIVKVKCATCHAEQSHNLSSSVHSVLGQAACESCHGNVHELKAAAQLAPAKCSECHAQQVHDFEQSVHHAAAAGGDPDAPKCESCHGAVHKLLAAGDPASTVARKHLADTCAVCHSSKEFLSRHKIPVAHPVEQYKQSVHGRAVAAGNEKAAACSDCHGSHAIFAARDARARINHWNIAETCAQCHAEIAKAHLESVHGQAVKAGVRDAPVCNDCHGEHLILGPAEARSPVNAARVSSVTCGRCHGDERLAERYNLPADRLPSYADSYHGLAMREGSLTVANCASCHGAHSIFPSNDARSTVNAANLARTCGNCHSGAGEKFAIGPVHVQVATGPAHPVVKWVRSIYQLLIPLALGFMILHNLLDLLAKLVRPRLRLDSHEKVVRMNLYFRIAHWGVMLSFPTLVLTGFALRYPDAWWSRPLFSETHAAFRRDLHRVAAVVLLAATMYHIVHIAVSRRDRAFLKAMLPRWNDLTDLLGVLGWNLGLRRTNPRFAKFNYAEKLEYWAFLWGTVIMGISGFLLWFNNLTLRFLPKWMIDVATAVHWYEALLATFSILLWHLYFVIFDPLVYPMDLAWLTGKVSADHLRHARPEYFHALERAALTDSVRQPTGVPSGGDPAKNESKTGGPS